MVSTKSAFFAGDYLGCVEAASRESSGAPVRSLWCRALVHLGRAAEAKALAKGPGALDRALHIYADVYALRHTALAWDEIIPNAEAAAALEGDRDEAAVILSLIYGWAGRAEDAHRLAGQSASLEGQLLLLAILMGIGRFDLAERKLDKLKKSHVDEVAFQLVEAEFATRRGAAKEALYIYQELAEVHGRTAKLLNAQAGACLLIGRLSEAESLILEILQQVDPLVVLMV